MCLDSLKLQISVLLLDWLNFVAVLLSTTLAEKKMQEEHSRFHLGSAF